MAGRPKATFTNKEVEQLKTLARCHCPDNEIAAYLGIGETTLKRHFGPLLKEQRDVGKANIRALQYSLAMKGDKALLIWLGKQILGQWERTQIDLAKIPEEVFFKEAERRAEELERAETPKIPKQEERK